MKILLQKVTDGWEAVGEQRGTRVGVGTSVVEAVGAFVLANAPLVSLDRVRYDMTHEPTRHLVEVQELTVDVLPQTKPVRLYPYQ